MVIASLEELERDWERSDSTHECLERVSSDVGLWVWGALERESEGGRGREQCMVMELW